MPIAFELVAANVPKREVAAEMLARVDLHGYTVIADKGFTGADFEALMAEFGRSSGAPTARAKSPATGGLGTIRQWIESVFDTLKGQISLEHHGSITMPGLMTRIAQRLLALAAALWHNWNISQPDRHLTAYDH